MNEGRFCECFLGKKQGFLHLYRKDRTANVVLCDNSLFVERVMKMQCIIKQLLNSV